MTAFHENGRSVTSNTNNHLKTKTDPLSSFRQNSWTAT